MPASEERALLHGYPPRTYRLTVPGTCETCHVVSHDVAPVVVSNQHRWLCPTCTPGGNR